MGSGLEMGIQASSALKQSLRPQEARSAQLGRRSERAWPVGGDPAEVDETEQLGKEVGKSQTAQDRGRLYIHVTRAPTRIHSATTHMYPCSHTSKHAYPPTTHTIHMHTYSQMQKMCTLADT